MMTLYDDTSVRLALKRACRSVGGTAEFGRIHGIPAHVIDETIAGALVPSGVILKLTGFSAVTRYIREDS